MLAEATAIETVLAQGRVLTLADGAGRRVACIAGTLWVTQDYDVRDIVLEAGASFVLDRPGHAVVQPLGGPARVRLDAALLDGACEAGAWAAPIECRGRASAPALH